MLISHKHKFITIDIPKTGTRSLRETLTSIGIVDFFGPPGHKGELFKQHSTAKDIKLYFDVLYNGLCSWDDYTKFTIVRDPWKRYLSFYMYNKKRGIEYRDTPDSDKEVWSPAKVHQGKECFTFLSSVSFDDTAGLIKTIRMQEAQKDFIVDEDDQILVDFFADTNTLYSDIKDFLKLVGVKSESRAFHENKSTYSRPYSRYYNQEAIDMVAEKEKWLIDKFNYDYK